MGLNLKVDRSRRGFMRRRRRRGGGGWIALVVLLVALAGSAYLVLQMRLGLRANPFAAGQLTAPPAISPTPTRSFDDFLGQAEAAEKAGTYRAAIALYDQASRRKPNDPNLHARIARLYVFLNDPAKGEQRARKALTIDVTHAPSRAVLCMALEWQARIDEAIIECRLALKADPNLAIGHAYLAEALADKEDKDGALAALQRALEIEPKNTDALRNMGYLYEVFGQYETALSWYERALEVNPKLPVVLVGIAKIRNVWSISTTDPTVIKGHGTAAVYALTQTIALDKDNAEAYEWLGESLRNLGEFDSSILQFDKAVKLDPKRISTYTRRGILRFQRYDYLNATLDFTSAISLSREISRPVTVNTYRYMGYSLQLSNRCGDARALMTEAQGAYPSNDIIRDSTLEIDKRCAAN
jgi:tetratricopeptide (TPR) repeat protein